jgi:hypothetical protein
MVDPELEKYWMPVDLYVGGAEHAVLHLLYARFWHKVLYDIGVVSTKEPFGSLVSQGMILGETEYTVYRDQAGSYCSADTPGVSTSLGCTTLNGKIQFFSPLSIYNKNALPDHGSHVSFYVTEGNFRSHTILCGAYHHFFIFASSPLRHIIFLRIRHSLLFAILSLPSEPIPPSVLVCWSYISPCMLL